MGKRNPVFDMMKGIGIILMLFGHMGFPNWVNQCIYSFHMPLFFFLSGYFSPHYNRVSVADSFKKHFKRLVLPYIVTMVFLILWAFFVGLIKHDYNMVIRHCLSLLWGSMDGIESRWGYIDNCPMWFLLALFWGKLTWDSLSKLGDKAVAFAFILSILTIVIHKWFKMVPWSIMQGLSSVLFLATGWFFNHHAFPKWLMIACLLLWPVAIVFSHMEMASIIYGCLPLDILGSMGGTLAIYFLCSFLSHLPSQISPIRVSLCWCGMMSLTILCMSHFIGLSGIGNSILIRVPFFHNKMWINAIETLLVFVLTAVVVHIPVLKKVYR